MMYKFFTNKHDLINKLQEKELQNESLKESWKKVQVNDLDKKTKIFQVSVQQEFLADEWWNKL